jgi:PEP-CTERM motif
MSGKRNRKLPCNWQWAMSLLFLCMSGIPASAQNIVVNGTFDTFVPSNGTGGSWTSSNISNGGWVNLGGNPTAYFILNETGLATNPRIEQVLSGLTIGQTYTVQGDYQIHVPLGDPANSFGVLIDTSVIFQSSNPVAAWTPFSTTFVATSTSHSYSIDNLGVFTAVPEPATWALMGLGMGGVSLLGWKYKKSRKTRRRA